MDSWRDRLTQRVVSWPLADRVLIAAAVVVLVGLVGYGLVVRGDGGPPRVAANATSTAGPFGGVTTSDLPTVAPQAETTSTTVAPTTTPEPTTTTAPPAAAPTTEAPPTTAPPTTAPPTTARRPVVTSPPPTVRRSGTFCGFVPGSSVDIDLNGRVIGRQTADANGCVTVNQ